MRKVFKCVAKETGYHFTQGKNYVIELEQLTGFDEDGTWHQIVNDKGIQHYIADDELRKFFIDLEQVRQDKLEELLK